MLDKQALRKTFTFDYEMVVWGGGHEMYTTVGRVRMTYREWSLLTRAYELSDLKASKRKC